MLSVSIYNHPQDVTEQELSEYLLLLPEWRRNEALKFRFLLDRVLNAKAYLLLCQGLKDIYGITESPVFSYIFHNKPILRDYPEIHFNISHTHNGVMCVISDNPIGCDIEDIPSELDIDLCHYCFSDDEISKIITDQQPCVAFTRLWTKKEALLKLTGECLNDNLPSLLCPESTKDITFKTVDNLQQGYVYTICQPSRSV